MKVTAKRQDHVPTFEPVEVTFTLESQKELDALGCCFNSGIVTRALEKVSNAEGNWHDTFAVLMGIGAKLTKTMMFNRLLRRE